MGKVINLLDATFDLDPLMESSHDDFTIVSEAVAAMSAWDAIDERPWINWNLRSQSVPLTNAARALQMLLPGTINVASSDSGDSQLTTNMTSLRAVAVPIFMNGNYKPCHVCQDDTVKETNYHLHQPIEYVVQLESVQGSPDLSQVWLYPPQGWCPKRLKEVVDRQTLYKKFLRIFLKFRIV